MKDFQSIVIFWVIELNVSAFSLVDTRGLNGHRDDVTMYLFLFFFF